VRYPPYARQLVQRPSWCRPFRLAGMGATHDSCIRQTLSTELAGPTVGSADGLAVTLHDGHVL
jgi:hypothetical protein